MRPGPYHSIEKAFRILERLAERAPQGVTGIAGDLRLEKSGVSRLLKTLAERGYAAQAGRRGEYQLGPRLLFLGERFLQGDRLVKEAGPVLKELAHAARASAHLAVVVGDQILVVAKELSPERIQVESHVGGRIAPHASALGKVLLVGLPEIDRSTFLKGPLTRFTDRTITDRGRLKGVLEEVRRQGYALEIGEEDPGVGCVAAPVRDATGRCVAALSVSGPLQGTPFRLDRKVRELTVAAARELSRRMGYSDRMRSRVSVQGRQDVRASH